MNNEAGMEARLGAATAVKDGTTAASTVESDDRFRQIFEQNEDAQILLEYGTCRIIDANPAAEALYGFARRRLISSGLLLFMDQARLSLIEELAVGVGEGRSFSIERMENRRVDGGTFTASLKGQVIRLIGGDLVCCTVRDVTNAIRMDKEVEAVKARLVHASRMTSIGTLASGVAHEVNNPNNFILFNSTLLSEVWGDALRILEDHYGREGEFTLGALPYSEMREVVPELITGILDGSRRIKAVIENLRDFSTPDRDGMDSIFDLNDALRSSVDILNHRIGHYTDRFELSFDRSIPPVRGSEKKMTQVMVNLIMNALHALPDRGCGVYADTGYDAGGECVVVRVRDEGCGMSVEVLDRITEPFYTAWSGPGAPAGPGLGLSIAYFIVREHGGSMEFDSAPGAGTTTTLRLPAVRGRRTRPGAEP